MKGKLNMDILDYKEVKKHIDILNVAYQLCLEIVEEKGFETRAICPFCRIQEVKQSAYNEFKYKR